MRSIKSDRLPGYQMRRRFIIVPSLITSLVLGGCASLPDDTHLANQVFLGEKWPVFHTSVLGSRDLHYADIGDTNLPLVVFIHGSPGSWRSFSHLMADPELQKMCRMISVDRPGYGKSEAGKWVKSLEQHAASIRPALDRDKAGHGAILVGHSFGGGVGVRLAMDYPDKVAALILIAASIDPELECAQWYHHFAKIPPFRWIIPETMIVANEEILPLRGELEKLLPYWEELKIPVIVIQGERDGLVSPANADFAKQVLKNSTHTSVNSYPDLNHFIPWSRPQLIKDAIFEMLNLTR